VVSGHRVLADGDLVRAAQDDDVVAFEELVRRHRDLAFRVALRICRDRSDAEDVTQEAIVRAWRALDGFRGDARFSTWLCRIVTNLAINRVTRARRHAREVPDAGTRSADPAERTVDAERLDLALRALDALTAEQRACFVLCEIEGLSYDETAQVLGVEIAAVKGRLFRARQDLAATLARYDGTGG
jgi:RNA polymerase sigma-70 factor, ECF subfamily